MPNQKDVHVSAPLTNLAIGTSVRGLIAPLLMPSIGVDKSEGIYYLFDAAKRAYAPDNDLRAPGAEALHVDMDISQGTYKTSGHALATLIPDETAADADNPPLDLMTMHTKFLISKVLVSQEIACKTVLDAAITQTDTPTKNWDDYTDGDPFNDIDTAIDSIEDATGYTPNVIAMDSKVWRRVSKHPDLIARVVAGGTNDKPAQLQADAFAALFGFEKVIIGQAQKNTAVKNQSASLSRMWGSDVYITYQNMTPVIDEPSFGYTINWNEFTGSDDTNGWITQTARDAKKHAWWVEVSKNYVHEVTMANAGYRIISVLA